MQYAVQKITRTVHDRGAHLYQPSLCPNMSSLTITPKTRIDTLLKVLIELFFVHAHGYLLQHLNITSFESTLQSFGKAFKYFDWIQSTWTQSFFLAHGVHGVNKAFFLKPFGFCSSRLLLF